jgi:hypothetical protein
MKGGRSRRRRKGEEGKEEETDLGLGNFQWSILPQD